MTDKKLTGVLKPYVFILLLHSCYCLTAAQTPGDSAATGNLSVSGFTDVFYAYNFNNPSNKDIPYVYNHSRHNEFNANLMLLNVSHSFSKARLNFGFQSGTYPRANYAAEPSMFRNIFQANAGIALTGKLWLDAGILPSHIGCESAITYNNWTLTRSLCAENSPYYETGARMTYAPNGKWTLAALAVNGWQNIIENNSNKAMGTQIVFVPSDKVTINSSSFIGEGHNFPDSFLRMRYFHDFYAVFQLNEKFAVTMLLDNGFEAKKDSIAQSNWMTYMLLFRYKPADKFAFCFRAERYIDPDGVIVSTGTPNNYQVTGISLNVDFSPAKNVLLRVEGKLLGAADNIFPKGNSFSANQVLLTTSLAVGF